MNENPSSPEGSPASKKAKGLAYSQPGGASAEQLFYLDEFRGRTLGILLRDAEQARNESLLAVLDLLRANNTRVLVIVPSADEPLDLDCAELSSEEERLEGKVWRALRERGRVVVSTAPRAQPRVVLDIARRLALFKVILLTRSGGYHDREGQRHSFVDLPELEQLLAGGEHSGMERLREVEQLLDAGVPNVNLCTVQGLHDELFTYSGSGTLFTRWGHTSVRPLGIDDYDAADDLIARGVAEGFLAPRNEAAIDQLLPHAFGAFVEDHHLAGIGGLLIVQSSLEVPSTECGELVSLYAVTRFLREGVGAQLVGFALERARALGLDYVFACSTSKRAGEFFLRMSFKAVSHAEVPAEKWQGYDPERRESVSCFRFDL